MYRESTKKKKETEEQEHTGISATPNFIKNINHEGTKSAISHTHNI